MAEKPAGEKVKQGQESENDANSLPNFRSLHYVIMYYRSHNKAYLN